MISERPHLIGQLASSPFDSEGVRTVSREIIEEGVLQTYLLTGYSGKNWECQAPGHAGGIHNWLVKPNLSGGLTALWCEMGTGLLGDGFDGARANLVTGDYSRGARVFGWKTEKFNIRLPRLPLREN